MDLCRRRRVWSSDSDPILLRAFFRYAAFFSQMFGKESGTPVLYMFSFLTQTESESVNLHVKCD